jgi:hypothetical protein
VASLLISMASNFVRTAQGPGCPGAEVASASPKHGGNLRAGGPLAVPRSIKARLAVFFKTRRSATMAKLPASSTPGVTLPVRGVPASVLGLNSTRRPVRHDLQRSINFFFFNLARIQLKSEYQTSALLGRGGRVRTVD